MFNKCMIPILLIYALHVHASSCLEEIHDLRKTVEENTEIFRSLKETVNNQERRIQLLETRLAKSEDEKLILARRLEILENFTFEIKRDPEVERPTPEILSPECNDTVDVKTREVHTANDVVQSVFRSGSPVVVAFYAYMSQTENNPGPHHTIIFDIPVTNVGNGYNHFSGTFRAPSSGVYVLSWTISCSNDGYVFTQLVVNSDAIGGILTNSDDTIDRISTTDHVVKKLLQGDVVFVRTAPSDGPVGDIESLTPHQKTSFSGWKLG